MKNRPVINDENIFDKCLEYLDVLRETGVTNMFGAGSYLSEEFGLSKKDTNTILVYWMETFGDEYR